MVASVAGLYRTAEAGVARQFGPPLTHSKKRNPVTHVKQKAIGRYAGAVNAGPVLNWGRYGVRELAGLCASASALVSDKLMFLDPETGFGQPGRRTDQRPAAGLPPDLPPSASAHIADNG